MKEYRRGDRRFTIRSVHPDDAPRMIDLLNQLDRETTFLSREPGEFSMTLEQEGTYLQGVAEDPRQNMLVAVVDGGIVGSCNAVVSKLRRESHSAGFGIALLKAAWGMGIGRTLMEEMIGRLRGQGVEKMHLVVDTKNLRAITLYQRAGFVVEGCIRRERKMADGSYRDSYYMGLDLTEGTTDIP